MWAWTKAFKLHGPWFSPFVLSLGYVLTRAELTRKDKFNAWAVLILYSKSTISSSYILGARQWNQNRTWTYYTDWVRLRELSWDLDSVNPNTTRFTKVGLVSRYIFDTIMLTGVLTRIQNDTKLQMARLDKTRCLLLTKILTLIICDTKG